MGDLGGGVVALVHTAGLDIVPHQHKDAQSQHQGQYNA